MFIYARISEDHERAESVPTQILNSIKHAKRMGWDVVHVFKDDGRSGYTGEIRPAFEDMLNYVGKGQADVLITRHHDSLTRNPDDFARLMHVCGKAKIKISLYTGGELDLSTASGGYLNKGRCADGAGCARLVSPATAGPGCLPKENSGRGVRAHRAYLTSSWASRAFLVAPYGVEVQPHRSGTGSPCDGSARSRSSPSGRQRWAH
jgi:hypothetical protein